MKIELLGELVPDEDIPEWLVSPPVAVGYFPGAKLPFILEDVLSDERPEEYAAAIRNFLSLAAAERDRATEHVYRNFTEVVRAVGADEVQVQIARPEDVWRHVSPTAIHVSRRQRRDMAVYVQVTAECGWEPEHGLQIVYRRGIELCRVSDQDGHLTYSDAYDLPENEDRIS